MAIIPKASQIQPTRCARRTSDIDDEWAEVYAIYSVERLPKYQQKDTHRSFNHVVLPTY